MPWPAEAPTSSPPTTTFPRSAQSGWARSTTFWACRSASSRASRPRPETSAAATSTYNKVDRVIRQLRHGKDAKDQRDKDDPTHDRNNPNMDYLVDEKNKSVSPTDNGISKIERMLGIKDLSEDNEMMHHVTAAM